MNEQKERQLVNWQALGAELVYTQDRQGNYKSFHWQFSQDYGIDSDTVVGSSCHDLFIPVAIEAYLERIKRVIERKIPEQCQWEFRENCYSFCFQLIIAPILTQGGQVDTIIVMGYLQKEQEFALRSYSQIPIALEPYQKLFAQITNKIRKTLSLQTIWQETVNSLGENLRVSRCLLIYCDPKEKYLEVKAEYCQDTVKSILGHKFALNSRPYWKQAISSHDPIIIEEMMGNVEEERSVLILSTFYQDQRNGIICLQQCDYCRHWSQIEIDLLQKLADQVGTAIAHATLYKQLEKAKREAEKVSQYKSDFLANTSHELRTPLHAIINLLVLILDGIVTDPKEQKDSLEEVYKSALQLLQLIDDILDIAKIEAGKLEIEFKTVSLNEVFANVDKKIRHLAARKDLHLQIKSPATYEDVILYTNHQRLVQIMLNLVSNAIKFTEKGGIFVTADIINKKVTFKDYQFPGMVKISVADTGIGVPLHKQDELFEKFFQVDNSRTKAYPGTGLGLAISQKFVENLGGKISFYSMGEGLGSTVTFTIPLNHIPLLKSEDV